MKVGAYAGQNRWILSKRGERERREGGEMRIKGNKN